MDLVVHPDMVLHMEAVEILLVAPCRLAHIRPETMRPVVQRFLLVFTPPVGHLGNGKIHHAAIAAPRPRHIVRFTGTGILHEIAKLVGFFPLFLIDLGDYRILRENYLETLDRKSTRLNSSHVRISYAVF